MPVTTSWLDRAIDTAAAEATGGATFTSAAATTTTAAPIMTSVDPTRRRPRRTRAARGTLQVAIDRPEGGEDQE